MSETPISLIDDKKSSQAIYGTDQQLHDWDKEHAYFERAKTGELSSIAPPEFQPFELKDEALVIDETVWSQPDQGFTQPPEFVQATKSHEDTLREMIYSLETDRQAFEYLVSNTTAVYLLRPLK